MLPGIDNFFPKSLGLQVNRGTMDMGLCLRPSEVPSAMGAVRTVTILDIPIKSQRIRPNVTSAIRLTTITVSNFK